MHIRTILLLTVALSLPLTAGAQDGTVAGGTMGFHHPNAAWPGAFVGATVSVWRIEPYGYLSYDYDRVQLAEAGAVGPDAVWGTLGVWAIQTGVGLPIVRMDTARATVRAGTSTAVRGPPYAKGVNPTIGMSLRLGQRWGGVAEMDRAFPDNGPAFTLTRAGLFVGW